MEYMDWSFLGGMIFGILSAFCALALIYLFSDILDKVHDETLDGRSEEKVSLVIDRMLANHVVRVLCYDNRPAIEDLVRLLKRTLS